MKSRMYVVVLSGILAAIILAGCSGGGAQEAKPLGDPAKGREIYDTGGTAGVPCSTCHTLDDTELVGPSFKGIGERAGTRVSGLSAEEYIRQSVKEPQAFLAPGFEDAAPMPPIFSDTLTDDDINNIIAFLLTQ